jgi:hypothetical protein
MDNLAADHHEAPSQGAIKERNITSEEMWNIVSTLLLSVKPDDYDKKKGRGAITATANFFDVNLLHLGKCGSARATFRDVDIREYIYSPLKKR